MLFRALASALFLFGTTATAAFGETRIVAWNVSPISDEGLADRADAFAALGRDLDPDVVVLVETTGLEGARTVGRLMGWTDYYVAVSDWRRSRTNPFFALEVAVLSKVPIERVVEYDPSPDGTLRVVDQDGRPTGAEVEEIQPDTRGVAGVDPLARTDRVTMRVDLANGLTVLPVHLKSNRNGACYAADAALDTLRRMGLPAPDGLEDTLATGFDRATGERRSNALKREWVMAAVKTAGDAAVAEGRTVLIAGYFNTTFEQGLVGSSFEDCELADYGCAKGPFPAEACRGDGYDDTFAILTEPLIGTTRWTIPTRNLPRTFDDKAFADRAIDHMAVPNSQTELFGPASRSDATYGSDHYPILIEMLAR